MGISLDVHVGHRPWASLPEKKKMPQMKVKRSRQSLQ